MVLTVFVTINSGKAYGIFNIKWMFFACVILFEVGSALCGAAPNMDAIIVGRVLAGVGGAGTYCGGLVYISVMTGIDERPLYVAGIAVMYNIGSVVGPVIGGGFAESSATWRWVSCGLSFLSVQSRTERAHEKEDGHAG
jgi:MFS family permease